MLYDLHCHSNCSDGELPVEQLIALAVEKKVEALSITDHDTLQAYRERPCVPRIKIIPGIEFSSQWQKMGVHIVGLNINPASGALVEGVKCQLHARSERAEKIAERLKKAGLANALEGARQYAGQAEVSRPHFAQFMVASGFSKSIDQAFKKHLGAGKAGDIKQMWADMERVIYWIREAGGVTVLAHPQKYSLTRSKLLRLVDDFVAAGGQGIEVLSGNQGKDATEMLRDLSVQKKLLASLGSDFHSPKTPWCHLGMHPALPNACRPVWENF